MPKKPDERIEPAKQMYLDGMKLIDIAKQLDLPEGTVRRWKSTHKWDSERSDKKDANVRKNEEASQAIRMLLDHLVTAMQRSMVFLRNGCRKKRWRSWMKSTVTILLIFYGTTSSCNTLPLCVPRS